MAVKKRQDELAVKYAGVIAAIDKEAAECFALQRDRTPHELLSVQSPLSTLPTV